MGVGVDLCMYDVVVKSSRSLSHLLVSFLFFSSCLKRTTHFHQESSTEPQQRRYPAPRNCLIGSMKISRGHSDRGCRVWTPGRLDQLRPWLQNTIVLISHPAESRRPSWLVVTYLRLARCTRASHVQAQCHDV